MLPRLEDLGISSDTQAWSDTALAKLHDNKTSIFDPVDFLNESWPTPSFTSAQPSNVKNGRLQQLQDASSEIQTLLSRLNAHNMWCSNSLTQLTDEILRSGSRLAYEVEILRSDVNSLYNLLTDTLRDDVNKFLPPSTISEANEDLNKGSHERSRVTQRTDEPVKADGHLIKDPEFISYLRTLNLIKSRLESTIKVFGEAMQWPLAPSELSVTSSLISVSAPEHGMISTTQDDKAREISRKLRTEVTNLLETDGGSNAGWEAAVQRLDELRDLASVWKGTAEEKARTRFLDSLAKVVEDRRRALNARKVPTRPRGDSITQRSNSMPIRTTASQSRGDGTAPAGGFLRNLQKLRDEIYLE